MAWTGIYQVTCDRCQKIIGSCKAEIGKNQTLEVEGGHRVLLSISYSGRQVNFDDLCVACFRLVENHLAMIEKRKPEEVPPKAEPSSASVVPASLPTSSPVAVPTPPPEPTPAPLSPVQTVTIADQLNAVVSRSVRSASPPPSAAPPKVEKETPPLPPASPPPASSSAPAPPPPSLAAPPTSLSSPDLKPIEQSPDDEELPF